MLKFLNFIAYVHPNDDTFQKEIRRFVDAFSDCVPSGAARSLLHHPLTAFCFAHNVLRPGVTNLVTEMREAGIQPATILQVLEKRATQVCAICKPKRIRKFSGEWRELCAWVESVVGKSLS
jgi:hypothetical protein